MGLRTAGWRAADGCLGEQGWGPGPSPGDTLWHQDSRRTAVYLDTCGHYLQDTALLTAHVHGRMSSEAKGTSWSESPMDTFFRTMALCWSDYIAFNYTQTPVCPIVFRFLKTCLPVLTTMQPLRPRVVPAAYHPLSLAPLPPRSSPTSSIGTPFSLLWPPDLFRDLRPAFPLPLMSRLPCFPTPPYLPLTPPTLWDDLSPSPPAHDLTKSTVSPTNKPDDDDNDVLLRLRGPDHRPVPLLSPLGSPLGPSAFLGGEVGPRGDEAPAEESQLRELERFAASFKARRIKLGFTQTNVGKIHSHRRRRWLLF